MDTGIVSGFELLQPAKLPPQASSREPIMLVKVLAGAGAVAALIVLCMDNLGLVPVLCALVVLVVFHPEPAPKITDADLDALLGRG